MFMFFSCGQMGWRGNSKRAGVHVIGIGYTRSGERTVSCGQMDGQGNRERAGAHAISVSGAGFRNQHTFAVVVRVNTSRLLLPTGIMGEEVVPEALFSQKIA
jgi:hypothetical protein